MTPGNRQGSPRPPPSRVLLIEDNQLDRRLITELLRRSSGEFEIDGADRLEEGLERLRDDEIDLVLLDLNLPDSQGLETFSRAHTVAPTTAIVVITGVDDREMALKAVQLGAQDYLDKDELDSRILDRSVSYAVERKRAELAVVASEKRFRGLFENVPSGIYQTDLDGRLTACNPALVEMLGYGSAEELQGVDLAQQLYSGSEDPERGAQTLRDGGVVRNEEVVLTRRDGSHVIALNNARAVRDAEDRPLYYEGTLTDITERREYEHRLEYLRRYDSLTGLPNRTQFLERLELAMARCLETEERLAVHRLDLDDFQHVNDLHGHAVGDALLVAVAHRLSDVLHPSDTIARFGGDEFGVLQRGAGGPTTVAFAADRLSEALRQVFPLQELKLRTSGCIGIAISDGSERAETLLTQAETALREAKQVGPGSYRFHDDGMIRQVRDYVQMRDDLHAALQRREFLLVYQPQFRLDDGRVYGIEALVRWQHPQRGVLRPADFLEVCRRAGLISDLGTWVLEEACRQRLAWLSEGLRDFPVAVNVSAEQFVQPDFARQVARVLERTGLPPELLELEVTEQIVMPATEAIRRSLNELRAAGVRLAIDDFGTGYSSLRYLRNFSFQNMKVAMEFVQGAVGDPDDAAIVDAVVTLARKLGLGTIAEGVETPEQADYLQGLGCDAAQGYLFCRPESADEVVAKLAPPPGDGGGRPD